ncbi:hypothetical protein DEO72_LG10g2800 [Vigna unguiculata]|uniref:Uncharacterized protein n=1 Tax=Vigna unguiculata TaxID=3917 RepID=A0A4D6NHZ6_VIGUN|nr:hypothetical protein DEO72_LG10g2800 [Vigna unguiculata]
MNKEVPSLLHHWSAIAQASSIVVVAKVAEPPPLSRSISLVGRLFYVTNKMNRGVVKLFWCDAVVKDGGDGTLAAFKV